MKSVMTVSVAVIMLIFGAASATVIDIPDDYPTVQQGINASSEGDTVLVQPGVYTENINFNGHNIIVASLFLTTQDTSYISSTIIDGDHSGSVVTFESGEDTTAAIIGFTVRNGHAVFGGGISCTFSGPTIEYNRIQNNSVSFTDEGDGAGIYCWGSSAIISHNVIRCNECLGFIGAGGGIALFGSSNPLIVDNIISENDGDWYGGGISCSESALRLINNTISGNTAGDGGGVLFSGGYGAESVISGNVISHNVGGGIILHSDVSITDNTIVSNSGGYYPAGIGCRYDVHVQVLNTIVRENELQVYLDENSLLEIDYSDIQGGWEGQGNIDCDPLFCGPANGDFHLHISSCCVGAGQDGDDIGAFGVGCGIPCDGYVIGDYNGSGVFNVADVVDGFSRLKTGQPIAAMICECPPGSGIEWAVAMDLNGSCTFNVADIVKAVYKLLGSPDELIPCPDCPPGG